MGWKKQDSSDKPHGTYSIETFEKLGFKRLMENVHPAATAGRNPWE